ncbi:hypothetical protein B9Z19DRAFT_1121795 [Tuber borchii]|uniref:Uncharacterized protein n=1 Tax=Tuber borchii TaxID=42251 RepID=A0A2T7A1Z2_TUBBO|nr:hypothetical protein B9Z19DRAFT_1121795 [Tuber borchii]
MPLHFSIQRALDMRSRSPLTMSFYSIPSVHRQKGVPIRVFSMALQSLLKGGSLCRVVLVLWQGVWKALTLNPDSGGIRKAIARPFDQISGALAMRSRNPLTPAFYTIPSIHHQKDVPIEVFSMALQRLLKGGSLCRVVLDVWKVLILKPDFGRVRHAIMDPFYDVFLRHPLCPLPKEDSWSVRNTITKPFYDVVLRYPICPPPKGHPHMSILHGATESSEDGVIMPGVFSPGCLESAELKARFRER